MVTNEWRTGPIAITGADEQVGTALQDYPADYPNQVRALRHGSDLAAAFQDAEVIVHWPARFSHTAPTATRRPKAGPSAGRSLPCRAASLGCCEPAGEYSGKVQQRARI